jgi:hypothetical protein
MSVEMDRRSFLGASLGAAASFAFANTPERTGMTVQRASGLIRTKAVSSVKLT